MQGTGGAAQNISAPFICEVPPFKATLVKALSMADYLFGNETEAAAFAKSEGWETTDVAEIASKISTREGLKKELTVVRTPPACLIAVAAGWPHAGCCPQTHWATRRGSGSPVLVSNKRRIVAPRLGATAATRGRRSSRKASCRR